DAHEGFHAPLGLLHFQFCRVGGNSGGHFSRAAAPAFRLAVFLPARRHGIVGHRDAIGPAWRNSRSKVLRERLLVTFCGATAWPSGPLTTSVSTGIAPWLTENKSSDIAASTATQPPERASTVCDGSNHGRAASLTAGASNADSAMSNEVFIWLSSAQGLSDSATAPS